MIVNSINSFSSARAQSFGVKPVGVSTISTSDEVLKQVKKTPMGSIRKVALPIALAASVLGGSAFLTACNHISGPDPATIVDPVERNEVQTVLCQIADILGVEKKAVVDGNKIENSSYIPVKGDMTYLYFEANDGNTFSCKLDKENSTDKNLVFEVNIFNSDDNEQYSTMATAYKSEKGVIFTKGGKYSLEFIPEGDKVLMNEVSRKGVVTPLLEFTKGEDANTIDVFNSENNKHYKAYKAYFECEQ